MDKKIYEISFSEKKIIIKNEIIYYFEYDKLKETVSIEEFDERTIETEYVYKTGISLFWEIIKPHSRNVDRNRYKKLVKYRKLKFLNGNKFDVSELDDYEFKKLGDYIESLKTKRLILDEQKFHMKDKLINEWIWNHKSRKMSREKLQEKYNEQIEDNEAREKFLSNYEKKVFKIRKDELLSDFKKNSGFVNFLKLSFTEVFYYVLTLLILAYIKFLNPAIVTIIFFIIIVKFFIKKNNLRKKLEVMIYSIAFYQDRIVINFGYNINRIKAEEIMSMTVDKASKYNLEFRISKRREEIRCNFGVTFTKMLDYELVKRERKKFLEILEEIPKWCVMNNIEFKIEK
ncbi:hypothetical protein AB8B23_07340 [Leptotrichia sp. HSP-342]|uniref:Uncharacterized protein n=1 Tax=Leptotrichia mesophila TaxID=3239303 RepID=A0AB39V8J2_9FUSO